MADIAFLLLVFFLVTTTMNLDLGINTKLPPIPPKDYNPRNDIHQRNVLVVLINAENELLVENEELSIEELRASTKKFLDNNGDGTCPYCSGAGLKNLSDNPNEAVVSLQSDRNTSYKTYVAVQNEIVAAYNELRDEMARERYGQAYESLPNIAKREIKEAYPQVISEAEPIEL